ncbi:MmgE/PrpD family protein [Agrococcus sp. TF02-05]|uniref:MmgE/PrpD family protein n=1 Tax=Agrococcus sp. TF02-05 TaxID=2815211 RepID=UPI001AA1082A|nr:MmgE/PrpD family protein [Agrococcus sp. TF02-05]MBO1769270.1 MmgE/PrpD family protein [Agrococcus sp. TF02-05]
MSAEPVTATLVDRAEQRGAGAAAMLADHVVGAARAPLAEPVRRAAKAVLLHNLVVGLAAHGMPLPGLPRSHALPWAERPATAPDLAFATALRMGARAQHDEHPRSVTHLGSAVTPAVLAVAPRDVDGGRLLAAIAAGYQVGGGLGVALLPHVRARGMRATGVVGPIASAAAVAAVLRLDPAAAADAIALAANRAAGYTEVWLEGTDEWRLQTAAAARDGLESALWAAGGARGATAAIEGRSGLLHALGVDDERGAAIVGELPGALGGESVIAQMLLKAHPVCAINQAAVEVAIGLRRELSDADLATVERVVVRLSDADAAYPGIDLAHPPASWAQAMMDARQGVAIALADGRVDASALHPGSAEALRLRALVDVVGGLPSTAAHGAAVEVELADGRRLEGACDGVEVDAERSARMALELLPAAGLPLALAERLPALVHSIDEAGGVARLVDALAGIAPWEALCRA